MKKLHERDLLWHKPYRNPDANTPEFGSREWWIRCAFFTGVFVFIALIGLFAYFGL